MTWGRWVPGAILAFFMLTAAPASAASVRYASPEGTGTVCTAAGPCDLVQAVNSASTGDTVILAGNAGPYGTPGAPLTKPLQPFATNVTIEGAPGQPRPVIYSNAESMYGSTDSIILDAGDVLRDVDIEGHGNFAPVYAVNATGTITLDHVISHALDPSEPACTLYDAVVINSLCASSGGVGISENILFGGPVGLLPVTLRDSTIVSGPSATGMAVVSNSSVSLAISATNTIIRGSGAAYPDIFTTTSGGGSITITLDHSNYATVDTSAGGTVTPAGTGSNQTAAPLFVNAAAGDFREAPGSPTIDHGLTSSLNGTTDLAGELRTIGSATDIGAYEFVPAPIVSLKPVSALRATHATLNGTLISLAAHTNYHFEYGATASYGHSTPATLLGPSTSPQLVSVRISGLRPGATVHYRLVAVNSGGAGASADETLRLPALKLSKLRVAGRVVSYRVNAPARVTFRVFRVSGGHRHLVGRFARSAREGANKLRFRGRRLAPGSYRLVAVGRAGGASSRPVGIRFVVH